jgi:hypothetical protein
MNQETDWLKMKETPLKVFYFHLEEKSENLEKKFKQKTELKSVSNSNNF